ncbi:MAG TPA: MarR family transcriptional regulator [Chloroflexia bacterium]|nr:MarR family transcriptional regulator [Chloroflexia bacterium]
MQIKSLIGFELVQLCRAHRNRAEELLNTYGLHTGQEMTLFHLWEEEGQTHSELAERMCVEPPTASKMLQRMETAGFLVRKPDPADARVSRVYLTEYGRSLEKPVLEAWKRLEEQTLRGMTEAEQALVRRLIMQMRTNLS